MAGIFKAYDIRGIYGDTLTEDIVMKIGRAFATFLKCRKVVVGRDMRPHSEPLFKALATGLTMQGANVIDLGLCSTPMSYYANGFLGGDAGVMITASHNTGEWNGLKLSRNLAIPISGDTGIADIEKIFLSSAFAPPAKKAGSISKYNVLDDYRKHVQKLADIKRPVRIAADFANAMGIYEAKALQGLLTIDPLFDTLDGTFPNHEANPLTMENKPLVCKASGLPKVIESPAWMSWIKTVHSCRDQRRLWQTNLAEKLYSEGTRHTRGIATIDQKAFDEIGKIAARPLFATMTN